MTANPPNRRLERGIERGMFAARWAILPCYIGLLLALCLLVVKFLQELAHLAPHVLELTEAQLVLGLLSLIDLSLAGSLLLIIAFSGYENFVSRMETGDPRERPDWMGTVDFSGLKLKLISSIVAISGIDLLKTFMDLDEVAIRIVGWKLAIHLGFVMSGVLLAWMDRLSGAGHGSKAS